MKTYVTLVLVLLCFYAKSQNSSLLKEGARLEYKSYIESKSEPGHFDQTTRLIFTVDSIRQNAGETFSYITKKGLASNNAKESYTISYALKSDNISIQLPFQFYLVDTIFRCDLFREAIQSPGYVIGCSYSKKFISLTIPFALTAGQVLATDRKLMKVSYVVHDSTGRNWPVPLEYEIRKVTVEGKETITTNAGTFDCFKIKLKGSHALGFSVSKMETIIYYSEKAGLVKWQEEKSYIELAEIK